MKKYIHFIILTISVFLLPSGCVSYYAILSEKAAAPSLDKYQNIYVGWIDLDEEKWKSYGYDTKEPWMALIRASNVSSFPRYLKAYLPSKNITTSMSKNDIPADAQLYIKFNRAEYFQKTSTGAQIAFGRLAGTDTLDLDISFIDVKNKKEVYRVTVSIYSAAGSRWTSTSFEGRVNNSIDNTAAYIKENLMR
jgi:hypothetical protein